MTTFTPEQEAEIQKRIDEARAKQQAFEQYRISADQFYRAALVHIGELTRQGAISDYVLDVGKDQYTEFLKQFFPKPVPAPDNKPQVAEDDEQSE